jgi:hypothetical protein
VPTGLRGLLGEAALGAVAGASEQPPPFAGPPPTLCPACPHGPRGLSATTDLPAALMVVGFGPCRDSLDRSKRGVAPVSFRRP